MRPTIYLKPSDKNYSEMPAGAPLKICIILSICVHLLILCQWPFLRFMQQPEILFQKIELTYFKEGAIKNVVIKDPRPISSIKHKSVAENIKVAKQKKIKIDLKEFSKIDIKKEAPAPKRNDTAKSAPEEVRLREEYYLKVREKIKFVLEEKCKGHMKEGEVYVRFVINRDGILKDLALYKSSGKNMGLLEKMAIESIKEASPFPPFDNEINETELLFRQPIQITYYP